MGFQRGIQKEFSKGFSKFFFFFKKNERFFFSKGFCFCFLRKLGNHATRLKVRCAQWMMRAVLSWSDFGPRRLCTRRMSLSCLLQQAVMWPTVQGFNKHASSRREAVSDSRGVQRISKKSTLAHVCRSFDLSNPPYSYPMTCRVTRRHCTTCKVNSSRSAQYPYQASISICGIVHVPALSSQYHSNSHQSWLMTSSAVSEIPNLEWRRISCECVSSCDSLFVSLPLRALCCCLLSRVSGMIAQSLSG